MLSLNLPSDISNNNGNNSNNNGNNSNNSSNSNTNNSNTNNSNSNNPSTTLSLDRLGNTFTTSELAGLSQTNGALNLASSLIGLANWDNLDDTQRLSSALGLYNQFNAMGAFDSLGNTANSAPSLGGLASVLSFANALEHGNDGAIVYSGLQMVDSLTSIGASTGAVTAALGADFLPGVGLVLALTNIEDNPLGVVSAICNFFPPYGPIIGVCLSIFSSLFSDNDIPMSQGHAYAHWDDAGQLAITTDQNEHGGGATAHGLMSSLVTGLQTQLSTLTDSQGEPLYSLIPERLPSIGYQNDPDGYNITNGAPGHLYLSWLDKQGQRQTRYYDGNGERLDGTGDTIASDFAQHAIGAIVPSWQAQTDKNDLKLVKMTVDRDRSHALRWAAANHAVYAVAA